MGTAECGARLDKEGYGLNEDAEHGLLSVCEGVTSVGGCGFEANWMVWQASWARG